MQLIKNGNVFSMFTKGTSLIITDEDTIDRIIDNPTQSLTKGDDRGFSQERVSLYDEGITLVDICKKGKENGAKLLSVSYDYFFGGSSRLNYPSDKKTLKAFKIIHDMAKEYGMGFSASIISPLDVGGGYAKENDNTGYTCQYVEGKIDDDGEYKISVTLQTQWLNNKGPIKLEIERIFVYAFNEERIEDTSLFYVNPQNIIDISEGVFHKIDKESIKISNNGYGRGEMQVYGKSKLTGYNRCFAVIKYRTPELDYFSDDVLDYMKSIIDMHNDAGIEYSGFYSDEMHIQFDWDLFNHFGDNEINTRYLSDSLIKEYAKRYGFEYQDFYKYMIYFAYHQHDFLSGKDAIEPSQHVFGKNESSIYKTWQFRKRYFEMLQRQVVDLCVSVKEYAQDVYSRSILTKAHSTWQESPTCDRFYKDSQFSEYHRKDISRYDYTPNYYWSSSIRENIAACYDYFKWNEYLTGGGTDHPEGGFADRNYYSQAFACSLGVLNNTPIAYNGNWGSPIEVLQRLRYVATTYGNIATLPEHNLVQGLKTRESEVLAVYPLDLNYVEERFGSWMVQYGYCNYITDEKLVEFNTYVKDGKLIVKDRAYSTMLILYSSFIKEEILDLMQEFVQSGGKLIWSSVYPLMTNEDNTTLDKWKALFGINDIQKAYIGKTFKDNNVEFINTLSDVEDMKILTDMRVDEVYPLITLDGECIAKIDEFSVGSLKRYDNDGVALYLGFRPRDDQSQSLGKDISTLSTIINVIGGYSLDSLEMKSRDTNSRYIYNQFNNGSISIANHYRTFYEDWDGKFFRDKKSDKASLQNRELTPIDINLCETINEYHIKYCGTGVLTYTVNDGNLVGFAGKETKGITIDSKKYVFSDIANDITWTKVEKEFLSDGIEELYVIKVKSYGQITLPIALKDSDEYKACICKNMILESDIEFNFKLEKNNTIIDIDEIKRDKWLAVYCLKK